MTDRPIHNHGPEEGPGLACREHKIGECQIDALTVTEREARLRERRAFKDGAMYALQRNPSDRPSAVEADRRYPLTKRVPREVTIRGLRVKVGEDGRVMTASATYKAAVWTEALTSDQALALEDILANPYEEISE